MWSPAYAAHKSNFAAHSFSGRYFLFVSFSPVPATSKLPFTANKFSRRIYTKCSFLARAALHFHFAASTLSGRFIINGKLLVSAFFYYMQHADKSIDERRISNGKSLFDAVQLYTCSAQPLSGRQLIAKLRHPYCFCHNETFGLDHSLSGR